MDTDKLKVFLSHCVRSEGQLAKEVARFIESLEGLPLKPWLCTEDIAVSALWQDEIAEAVSASDFMIIFITPEWLESHECQFEFNHANRRVKTKGKPIIIPMIRDWSVLDSSAKAEAIMANYNGISVDDSGAWKEQLENFFRNRFPEIERSVEEKQVRQAPAATPKPTQSSKKTKTYRNIKFCEFRSGSWNGGASGIIDRLSGLGVTLGQLIWIDAHNNGPDDEAIFSAFYDADVQGDGSENVTQATLKYAVLNTTDAFTSKYSEIVSQLPEEGPIQLVSATGSCNCNGCSVFYVFYTDSVEHDESLATQDKSSLSSLQGFSTASWNAAAEDLVSQLADNGIGTGQILAIDAHNTDPNVDSIFSCHYDKSLEFGRPVDGENLVFMGQNSNYGWFEFYGQAAAACRKLRVERVISLTSSCNSGGYAVTYLFAIISE